MKTVTKIAIAVLFMGCLFKLPIGYYQFIKIASFIGFIYLAYAEYEKHNTIQSVLCIGSAILFNPLIPIHFKRNTWQEIDKAFIIMLVLWIVMDGILYLWERKKNT